MRARRPSRRRCRAAAPRRSPSRGGFSTISAASSTLDVLVDDALGLRAATQRAAPGRTRGSPWRGPRRRRPRSRLDLGAQRLDHLQRALRPAAGAGAHREDLAPGVPPGDERLAAALERGGVGKSRAHDSLLCGEDLLHQPRDPLAGHVPVVLAVEEDERAERAGADAADLLDAEREVGRGAAGADAGVALELLEQPRRAAHVAGGAHAHGARVLAAGLGVEAVVEGGDAVDLGRRQAEVGRRLAERLLGQVPELGLQVVQDVHEVAGVAPRVALQHGRHAARVDGLGLAHVVHTPRRRRTASAQPPAIIGKIEISSSSPSGVSSICRCRTLRPLTKMMISPCRSSPSKTARRNGRP